MMFRPRRLLIALMIFLTGFRLGTQALTRERPVTAAREQFAAAILRRSTIRPVATLASLLTVSAIALFAWQSINDEREKAVARALTGGNTVNAPSLMIRFGCAGCHTIAGVPGADGQVGPALTSLRKRVFIGDGIRNTAPNLIAWIVDPHSLSANSAMPATGISIAEARDVAAFLYSR